jgi:phospholipid transport system substrate-binding protein
MKSPSRIRSSVALACAALCFAGLNAPARAEARVDAAVAFMQKTVDDVLGILNDKQLAPDVRLSKLEAIAMERFDFPRMALLVLGKNKNQLTPEQRKEFQAEFEKSLSLTYGKRIDRYTANEKIEIGEARLEVNKDVTVKTRITGGSAGDGVQIDYRLRETPDHGWLILDVIPEGVSLIQNFRSQVQEIVTQKGVDKLISTLREKNEKAERPPASAK